MKKTILITGSTDGIGLETARKLAAEGHEVLLHGRSEEKLERVAAGLARETKKTLPTFVADLSNLEHVATLAATVAEQHPKLDVLINNAGVYSVSNPRTSDGRDVRFVVNTIAPYLLTRRLLGVLGASGRVINLSSAAQSAVDLDALVGRGALSANAAYAQSKLALTMWSRALALELGDRGPVVVAVNPGSLLGTKMVNQAFGVAGADVQIGANILARAALSDEFAEASGKYFDNDAGRFADPHPDALDDDKCSAVVRAIESVTNNPSEQDKS